MNWAWPTVKIHGTRALTQFGELRVFIFERQKEAAVGNEALCSLEYQPLRRTSVRNFNDRSKRLLFCFGHGWLVSYYYYCAGHLPSAGRAYARM